MSEHFDPCQINVLMLFYHDIVVPCPKAFAIAFLWTCQLPVPRIWYLYSAHTTETIHPVQALRDDSFISHLVKTISLAAWRRRAVQSTQTACWTEENPEPFALRGWFSFPFANPDVWRKTVIRVSWTGTMLRTSAQKCASSIMLSESCQKLKSRVQVPHLHCTMSPLFS